VEPRTKLESRRQAGAPGLGDNDPHPAQNTSQIGRANIAGQFYAACSDDYDDEPCGCPICRRAAHREHDLHQHEPD
jgi:hypothetical protein